VTPSIPRSISLPSTGSPLLGRAVIEQIVQQLLRARSDELANHPTEGVVGECLASDLLGESVDGHAHRADERLADAFLDDSLEQPLAHDESVSYATPRQAFVADRSAVTVHEKAAAGASAGRYVTLSA
jgi:hypothetical protein